MQTLQRIVKYALWLFSAPLAAWIAAEWGADHVQRWITRGMQPVGPKEGVLLNQGNYAFSSTYSWIVTLCTVLILAIIIELIVYRFLNKYKKENEELVAVNTTLRKEYDACCHASAQILDQLFDVRRPEYHPSKIEFQCYVDPNGDARIQHDWKIRAVNEPVRFWEYTILLDNESPAFESISQIKLDITEVSADNSLRICYLPQQNRGRRIDLGIWFLPEIQPNTERNVRITYECAGYFINLVDNNEDIFDWNYSRVTGPQATEFSYKIIFHPKMGQITCRNIGTNLPHARLSQSSDIRGLTWEYRSPGDSLLGSHTRLQLRKG